MVSKLYSCVFTVILLFAAIFNQANAADQKLIEEGGKIYYNHCFHCHGERGAGDGHLVNALKVKPADLTTLDQSGNVAKRVLGAVLGRHKSSYQDSKMPLLKDSLSLEKVYALIEYIETLQTK